MIKTMALFALAIFMLVACGEARDAQLEKNASNETEKVEPSSNESGGDDGLGVGPIKSVTLGDLDENMAKEGEELFTKNCAACHKIDKRFVGPALAGVTERRKPEWIMNMIMNPEQMVKEDPVAKELLAEYLAPMANQNISEDQARKIVEYFRLVDSK
ncbi:MAG: cytochrome c [Candidatus Kapaibacterium sp.]|nr:cytochrome c [Ignavibacteriota bacterium]